MNSIGADPEFFVRDNRSGSVLPICGLLGGTKNKPVSIPNSPTNGLNMQEDNVMGEFNIPPAENVETFQMYIRDALKALQNYLTQINPAYFIDKSCSRLFHKSLLTVPSAQEFGCSPDFNAYEDGNVIPTITPENLSEDDGQWRFAGGHIHLGYNVKIPPFVVANLADVFIGLGTVEFDKQEKRRTLYGQPGRFRPKSYGIEYRTLSNFWIFNKSHTFRIAEHSFNLLNYLTTRDLKTIQKTYAEIPWGDVQQAIQKENTPLAKSLMNYCFSDLQMAS